MIAQVTREEKEPVVIPNNVSVLPTRYRLVYLGLRPTNTLRVHEIFSSRTTKDGYDYRFPQTSLFQQSLQAIEKLDKDKGLFVMPFVGPREGGGEAVGGGPSHPLSLRFESRFESGNLDCAVQVSENEYDLFMRVDSNTKGHLQWFHFSV